MTTYLSFTNCTNYDENHNMTQLQNQLLIPSLRDVCINRCNIKYVPLLQYTNITMLAIVCCKQINSLPILPDQLQSLDISYTNISELPNVPLSLNILEWNGCDYFHINQELADKLNIRPNLNYNKIISQIQLLWLAKKRLQKLKFCRLIMIIANQHNYAPNGFEYQLLCDKQTQFTN
jgi:hypothetical protein